MQNPRPTPDLMTASEFCLESQESPRTGKSKGRKYARRHHRRTGASPVTRYSETRVPKSTFQRFQAHKAGRDLHLRQPQAPEGPTPLQM